MAYRISDEARRDLDEISEFLNSHFSEPSIRSTLGEIEQVFDLLGRLPLAGRARDNDLGNSLRSFATGEYVVLYRLAVFGVIIVRVIHGSRDIAGIFSAEE
jgi:toxin ParE1/3/4